ncbi:MAG: helix-hairpin-helix domain-containing protein [Phycisphaerales bacterium]
MTRRAVVLLVVLVVVAVAALSGASALSLSTATLASSSGDIARLQSRALAWSGVQAALAELAEQRRDLLVGKPPRLTAAWDLYTMPDGRRAVVRLLPMRAASDSATPPAGPTNRPTPRLGASGSASAGDGGDEPLAISEAARINLNTATPEMIAAVTGCEPALADAIVAARPFGSVDDLLRVSGVAPDFLDDESEFGPPRDVLTVFSADPNVQAGVGASEDTVGLQRLNLNTPWSDRLGRDLDQRFGDGAGETVKWLMGSGKTFGSLSEIVGAMRLGSSLSTSVWAMPLDFLTTTPDPFLPGKIDLMTAPARVLAAVPGISREAADEIVRARESLADDLRITPTWPVSEGILDADQMQQALDHVVTRSMQWRVRVEVGIAPAEGDGPLERRMVLEAVLDVASERPRVAYLREIGPLEGRPRATGQEDEDTTGSDRSAAASTQPPAATARGSTARAPESGSSEPPANPPAPVAPDATASPSLPPRPDEGEAAPVDRRVGRWASPGDGAPR